MQTIRHKKSGKTILIPKYLRLDIFVGIITTFNMLYQVFLVLFFSILIRLGDAGILPKKKFIIERYYPELLIVAPNFVLMELLF